jgi:hypothetical protein
MKKTSKKQVKKPSKKLGRPKRLTKDSPRYLTRLGVAKLAGVSKMAVVKALRSRWISLTESDTIDSQDPEFVHWLANVREKKARGIPNPQNLDVYLVKPESSQGKPAIAATLPVNFGSRQQADIAKIQAQVMQLTLKNERMRAELVNREEAKRVYSEIYNVQQTELLSLGDRLGPEIAAMTGIDKPDTTLAIGQLIRSEISKALDHVYLIIEKFVRTYPEVADEPEVESHDTN